MHSVGKVLKAGGDTDEKEANLLPEMCMRRAEFNVTGKVFKKCIVFIVVRVIEFQLEKM